MPYRQVSSTTTKRASDHHSDDGPGSLHACVPRFLPGRHSEAGFESSNSHRRGKKGAQALSVRGLEAPADDGRS